MLPFWEHQREQRRQRHQRQKKADGGNQRRHTGLYRVDELLDRHLGDFQLLSEERDSGDRAGDDVHVQRQADRADDQRRNQEEEQEHLVPKRLFERVEKNPWFERHPHQPTLSRNTDSSVLRRGVTESISTPRPLRASMS